MAEPGPEKDIIDAEFAEADEDGPVGEKITPQKSNPKPDRHWGSVLFLLCLVGAGIYWMFGRGGDAKQTAAEPWPAGWFDLLDCSYTVSFDGMKELNFFDNKQAVLYDKSIKEKGKYLAIDGKWTFDETTQLYAVTLSGETTTYSLVEPNGNADMCMLVKGDLGAVDLRTSWFSSYPDQKASDKDDR